ncbi:MAG TPA: hypothetical protein PLY45_06405 [bacterium]|nr:hypothetical protein [bacterium]
MLSSIPTTDHLSRMYHELSLLGAGCVGERRPWPYKPGGIEETFALGAEMSRYDPRLFGILTSFMDKAWERMDPLRLRSFYERMSTPQAVAVMAEFLKGSSGGEKLSWLAYIQVGLKPVPTQLFFNHLYRPGGHLMRKALEAPLEEFKRWGFLAREAPVIDEASRVQAGSLGASSRRNVALGLLKARGRIRLSDYLAALPFRVSRQQALIDLQSVPGIRLRGRGRGARWEVNRNQ